MSNEPPNGIMNFIKNYLSKIALNLSRGLPIKYTSSNRIASLVGNGIYTFVDKKTQLDDFFNEDEIGTYNSIDQLGNKVENLISKPKILEQYAKNGVKKYLKVFNNIKVSKMILNKIFNLND